MNKRKAQVTLFIILGLVTLISIAAIVTITLHKMDVNGGPAAADNPAKPLEMYVSSCIEETAKDAILENSYRGGYLVLPPESTTDLEINAPYYLLDGTDLKPNDDRIASEIADYIDINIDICLDNFAAFAGQGINITADAPSTNATLSTRQLWIKTEYTITLEKEGKNRSLYEFEVIIPATEFYRNINTSRQIVESQIGGENLALISDLALDNGLLAEIIPHGFQEYIINLTDSDYLIDNKTYHLRFAVRYI